MNRSRLRARKRAIHLAYRVTLARPGALCYSCVAPDPGGRDWSIGLLRGEQIRLLTPEGRAAMERDVQKFMEMGFTRPQAALSVAGGYTPVPEWNAAIRFTHPSDDGVRDSVARILNVGQT